MHSGSASNLTIGYYQTEMNQTTLPNIASTLSSVLGNHIVTHKVYMSNESYDKTSPASGGAAKNGQYYDSKISILSALDVYNFSELPSNFRDSSSIAYINEYNYREGPYYRKLDVFKFESFIAYLSPPINPTWLKDMIYTPSFQFTDIIYNGNISDDFATESYLYIRPRIMFI